MFSMGKNPSNFSIMVLSEIVNCVFVSQPSVALSFNSLLLAPFSVTLHRSSVFLVEMKEPEFSERK